MPGPGQDPGPRPGPALAAGFAALCAAALATVLSLPPALAQQAAPPSRQAAAQNQPAPPLPAQADPDPRRTPVVRVVQEAGPAVVSIISARTVEKAPFAGESILQRFFGEQQPEAPKRKVTTQNLGSGVLVDGAKAYVLTNAHVIAGASQITARLFDGREFQAQLLGADQDMDLAVLRLELPPGTPPLPQARMGDSAELLIGEPVVAIGNPFGLSHTVTTGVISALDRSVGMGQHTITGLIQTDAAINPGNSGGPLLNILGQVVGINAAVFAQGGGLSFAIPVNKAKRALEELIATGRVAHIWLGLLGENMTPDQMALYALARPGGMVVTEVFPGTSADRAGIRPGDALLAIGGQRVQDKAQFLGLLLNYAKGDTLSVLLSRGSEHFQVKLQPQALDREASLGLIYWRWGFAPGPAELFTGPGTSTKGRPCISVADVRKGGPAARLGLKPGDTVMQIGSLRTGCEADLLSAFYRYQMHDLLILSVQRDGLIYTLRMKI